MMGFLLEEDLIEEYDVQLWVLHPERLNELRINTNLKLDGEGVLKYDSKPCRDFIYPE